MSLKLNALVVHCGNLAVAPSSEVSTVNGGKRVIGKPNRYAGFKQSTAKLLVTKIYWQIITRSSLLS